jgi:hypothetical protein
MWTWAMTNPGYATACFFAVCVVVVLVVEEIAGAFRGRR